MSELKELLELALSDGHGPAPQTPIDPAGDLARGRALRRRRRMTAGATAASVSALLVAAGFAPTLLNAHVTGNVGNAGPPATVARPSSSGAPSGASSPGTPQPGTPQSGTPQSGTPQSGTSLRTTPVGPAIALVAYHGEQVPGYRVAEVPAGWVIQGGNDFVLTIAPKDFPDKEVNGFLGKLVVMLESEDAGPLNTAAPGTTYQPVNGRPGVYHVDLVDSDFPTASLHYLLADGRQMVVQAPVSLGWDARRLARFAEGVTVLANAQGGHG